MSEATTNVTPGRKGNLTGSARKLKDHAADWHNLIQKWERLNDEGSTTATKIVNLVMNKKSVSEADIVMEGDSSADVNRSENSLKQSHKDLEEECHKLKETVDKMANILLKMENMVHAEHGICELEAFQYGEKGRPAPLFHTWSTKQFGEISERARQKGLQYAFEGYNHNMICNRLENNLIKIEAKAYNVRSQRKQQPLHTLTIQMETHKLRNSFVQAQQAEVSSKLYESYKQELALKQTILQELAHTSNADLSMVYLSSWLYQPYIEDTGKLLMESLLLETGHRPV